MPAPSKRSAPFLVGVTDEATTLYGDPESAFQTLKALHVQVVRVNLYWGGTQWAVSRGDRPTDPSDPGDPAYDWSIYDRLVRYAALNGVQVVFSILFTPAWANDGAGRNVAPTDPVELEAFAYAAAVRYSGYWAPPTWQQDPTYGNGATPLPAVTRWTRWRRQRRSLLRRRSHRRRYRLTKPRSCHCPLTRSARRPPKKRRQFHRHRHRGYPKFPRRPRKPLPASRNASAPAGWSGSAA